MAAADPREVRERFAQLKDQRSGWESMWQDIRDYVLPDLGCFNGEDRSDGGKRWRRILDAEASNCADVLAAGLLGGVSSPSRPWLRLTTLDPDLDSDPECKEWLAEVERLMLQTFAKAEVYNQLHQSYLELPAFGQAVTLVRRHPTQIINLQNLTVGEYWLSDDPYGRIDTLYRELWMTAKQMVQQWGLAAVSPGVRRAYERSPFTKIKIIHAIEPRWERDDTKRDKLNKPFRSIYFEEGRADGKFLSEGGFDDFPALCPRWMTCGNSVYGRGPGAKAAAVSRRLQMMQRDLATAVDYACNPPVLYPSAFKSVLQQFRPGGRIPVTPNDAASVRSAWDVRPNLDQLMALINQSKAEIQKLFYVNVFQMIAASAGDDRTATEVAALEQEKTMMMGPVLERLHTEMLDPLVDNAFAFMLESGKVPPIPDALSGKSLNVEYISVLAEQQKNASVNGIQRLTQQIGMLAQINANALDKLDVDAVIDELADMNGVPPSMIVNSDKVALIRQQRAEQQQQQLQMQQASQAAAGLKDFAGATDSPGLRQVMSAIQESGEGAEFEGAGDV